MPLKLVQQAESTEPLALVFTDMVGSSAAKRAASLGENANARDKAYLESIQTEHLRLVREAVAKHHGTEIMTIGDSFFLTFEDVNDAVRCCAAIQQRLRSFPIDTPAGPLQLRIGIHVGTPEFFENSWHGTDVDTAARAESAGAAQQIVITDAARALAGDMAGITFRKLGTFALKGVGDVKLWDTDYDNHGLRTPALTSNEAKHRSRRLLRGIAAAALVIVLAAAAYFFWQRHQQQQEAASRAVITAKDSIILADLENKTGDPVFDSMLTQAIAIQLEQSPVLNLVSQQHMQQSMQYLGKSPDDPITPALAREIGEREGIKAYLSGSIVKLGSSYIITLSAQNTRSGDDIASEQAEASDKDHVLDAIGKVSTAMRARLGESLSSIQKLDTPFGQATTPSIEAFRAYALGDVDHEKGLEIPQAEGHYREAVEIDPNFAMAWARLGVVYNNAGQLAKAVEYFTRAHALSKNVSERERLYIEGHYTQSVTGNIYKTIESLELATKTYPLVNDNWTNLGVAQQSNGQYEESLVTDIKAVAVDPADAVTRENLLETYLALDRVPDAAQAAADLQRLHNDDGTTYLVALYMLDFFQGNTVGMARMLSRAEGRPDEMQLSQVVALTDEFIGQYAAADKEWQVAQRQAAAQKAPDAQAGYLLNHVSGRALAGSCEGAARDVQAALAVDKSKPTLMRAAYTAALCDDRADAMPLLAKLGKDYPEDTIIQHEILPQSRAVMDLAEHQPAAAIQELEGSQPFDFGSDGAYLRGLSYLDLKDGAHAVEAFQRATQYKGADLQAQMQDYAQAMLGLARAYTLTGNKAAAKHSYEAFFTLWKSADADLPQLLAARKEYAALQ
jgi:class 3 adenylate cyclase/Flp pilus assembly protein TadD/predicted negative regulator of RcsB-dependent stress response